MEDTQKKTIAIVLVVAVASVGLYIGYNLWDKANKEDNPIPDTDDNITTDDDIIIDTENKVTDMEGRQVTIPKNFTHLLAFGTGALRFVSYFKKGDMIVATESRENANFNAKSYMWANPRYKDINSLSNTPWTNIEAILALTPVPEVIIACDYDDGKAEQLSTMVDAGIAVVIIHELQSPFDTKFPIQLRLIGKVFGEETRAEQLLTYINGLKADLANRVKNITDRPTAYIAATSYAGTRPFTFSTSKYDPFDLINVDNIITSEMTGGSEIPKNFAFEEITALQPNYVFIDATGYINVKGDYTSDPTKYAALNAFDASNWTVYMSMPFIWYGVNFDNIFVSAYQIGKVLYPAEFNDINMTAKANEIYQEFVGKACYEDIDGWYVEKRGTHIEGIASFA